MWLRWKIYAKLGFGRVLKRSLSVHWMQAKLFELRIHAVSVGKSYAGCQIFGRFASGSDFFISESEQNFSIPHTPTENNNNDNLHVGICRQMC